MKVEILPGAETDIIRQFRYYLVEQDAPLVALRFRESVRATAKRLGENPRIGPVFRCPIPGLRSWPVKGFEMIRVYYVAGPDSVRIVRILHGKRDVRRILGRGGLRKA